METTTEAVKLWFPRYGSDSMMFDLLMPERAEEFRVFARANGPTDSESWSLFHPTCRDEWVKAGHPLPDDARGGDTDSMMLVGCSE